MWATDLTLRPATRADQAAIAEIYNHYVLHSTCTFATEPEDPAYWETWFKEHVGVYPAIVAVRGGEVLGWGSLSRWNARYAYRFSAEDTVYVADPRRGQGIGRAILEELIGLARQHGHRSILAQIAADQPASEALHQRLGFRLAGCLKEVGYKFDRWIDVRIWQLILSDDHDPENTADAPRSSH